MNDTGLAISQTIHLPVKIPMRLSSAPNGELSRFVSLLSGVINRNAISLPTAQIPVTARNESQVESKQVKSNEVKTKEVSSKGAKSQKQFTVAAGQALFSKPPLLFQGSQFMPIAFESNELRDQANTCQQPIPVADEGKTAASRSMPSPATIDLRFPAADVAFGVRLAKNQPSGEDPERSPSLPLAADLAPTPDGANVAQAPPDPSAGGVASPSTRPHTEVAEVLAGDSGTMSKDSQPTIRPEPARPRTPAPENVMPPTPQQPGAGDKGSADAQAEQKESARPAAPKENQAVLARNVVHLQASSGVIDVSARQFEMARAAEPESSRSPTSPSDLRGDLRAASDPEINPTLQQQPARQISLKLTGPDSTKVDLQLTERAGKMQIAVRTPDHALAKSMQSDLSELVGRLENRGFKADAWIPTSGRHAETTVVPPQSSQGNSQTNPERQSGGSGSGPQQQRQGQNESNQRQQARWKTQLEETVSAEDKRMENT